MKVSNKRNTKRGDNKHGGNKIKGQVAPFKKYMDEVIANLRTPNDLDACRDDLKDLVALRMLAVKSKPLQLDDETIDALCNIIKKYIDDKIVNHYIHCSLKFYAGTKAHRAEIDITCSSCTARDKNKSLRHAQQDCFALADHYNSILKNIVSKRIGSKKDIKEVVNIFKAIKFVADYIYNMQIGIIPKTISKEMYNSALCYDSNLANFYAHDNSGNYVRISSKTRYNRLDLKASTELFIQGYKK